MPTAAHHPSRRGLLRATLIGGAAALTAGCGADLTQVRWADPSPAPSPAPDADELARRRALVAVGAQEDTAADLLARRPELAGLLADLRAALAVHRSVLGPEHPATSAPAGLGSSAPPTAVTGQPAELAEVLVAGSLAARADARRVGGGLARLLAALAASRQVHATRLAAATGAPAPTPPAVPALTDHPPRVGAGAPALTAALDGQHAAVFTFTVVAARLAGPPREQALVAANGHRELGRLMSSWLVAAGRPVPPPAPAYQLPGGPAALADPAGLAAAVEDGLAALAATLVAASTGDLRAAAAALVSGRALAALSWRGSTGALPGMPEWS